MWRQLVMRAGHRLKRKGFVEKKEIKEGKKVDQRQKLDTQEVKRGESSSTLRVLNQPELHN